MINRGAKMTRGWWAVGLLLKTPTFQIQMLRHDCGTVGRWSKIKVPCSEKKNSLGGCWAVGLLLKTPTFQIQMLRHDYGTVGRWSKIEVPCSEKKFV